MDDPVETPRRPRRRRLVGDPLAPEREGARLGPLRPAGDLAQLVVDDGFRPDVVIAVARGGLTVAGAPPTPWA